MVKRKIEKAEEAEIIPSNDLKPSEIITLKKLNNFRMQVTIFFLLFFICLLIIFGFLLYEQQHKSAEITKLQKEISTLTPIVSLEAIEKKLSNLELKTQKKSIILINQAVKDLEVTFLNRINLLPDIGDNRRLIKLVQDEALKLHLKLEEKISEANIISNKNRKALPNDGLDDVQIQIMLDGLKSNLLRKFNILQNKFVELEEEILLSKTRLLDIESFMVVRATKEPILNIESFSKLKESFIKISYSALKLETQRNIGEKPWSVFVSTLKSLFVFRSTEPIEGNTLDAILSRAEHMLSVRNFEGCLKQLSALDEASLELFSEWMEKLVLLNNKIN